MRIAGIIAEYDPFHGGHAYHIEETKRRSGADGVICVMSGPFVQRGVPAFLDKYVRAEAAVRGGADLVLELPPEYACASAEAFAAGGIAMLGACGCVTDLSFGAETDDLELLQRTAEALVDEALMEDAKELMKGGLSYAAALAGALKMRDPAMAEVISLPNNLLAAEYLKALKKQGLSNIVPHAVKRLGAGYHDESGDFGEAAGAETAGRETSFPSAASIRRAFFEGRPEEAAALARWGAPADVPPADWSLALGPEAVTPLLMSRLRTLAYEGADLTQYEDVSPDLAARILAQAPFTESFEGLCSRIVTRAFTLARVRRALLHILLGIRKGDSRKEPSYLKVLALREGSPAVRAFAENARLPRITKAADDPDDLAAGARFAQDIYHQMVFAAHGVALPDDFRKSPFVLRS